jgi:uncharacterized membrane protein YdjX (TVP38/TMEM64 family)
VKNWRVHAALALLLALGAWAFWSYESGGILRVLLVPPTDGSTTLEALRAYVLAWGMWAPVVYIAAVTVEVLVAPIPGTLLYAPAGAIFGGFMGGTLSLIGNVTGAAIACWLAGTFGSRFGEKWVIRHNESGQLTRLHARLRSRNVWIVIALLRLNPLTSSDLVSYAAGVAGIRVRHVAAGTFLGMLPQCYLQAYLAQTLFEALPSGPWVIAGSVLLGVAIAVIIWRLTKRAPPLVLPERDQRIGAGGAPGGEPGREHRDA